MRAQWLTISDGRSGFQPWVAEQLRGQSGVYAIRSRETHRVLYVGESHKRRLYETLTRHFQSWSLRSEASYDRTRVEVLVILTASNEAIDLQYDLIEQFRPRDNSLDGHTLLEDASS